MQARVVAMAAVGCVLAGCADAPGPDEVDAVDVRVPIPAPDPRYVDLITPEQVLQPGEEKQLCLHLANDRGDLAIRHMQAMQGASGHHLALFTTTAPKPPGTVEDCTSAEANAALRWFVLTFDALPAGHGIAIPAGMRYVLQFHYINAGDRPLRVRDVARLERVDAAAVTTWVSTLISQDLGIEVPVGASTRSSDCVLAADLDLLVACGHMHELGVRFQLDVGPSPTALSTIYAVDRWQPSFRDGPPVNSYYAAPMHLGAGTLVRTTCEYLNPTSAAVGYPTEMCATFAYVGGSRQPIACQP